jgi:hypothetical protein
LVEIAAEPASFAAKAEALLGGPRERWLEQADRYLATTSWDKTWRQMSKLMDAVSVSGPRTRVSPRESAAESGADV